MSLRKVWPAAAALVLAGCGKIPDVTVNYYFPRAKTQFAVTQTVGCSPKVDGKHRIIRSVISVISTSTNSADLDWKNEDGSLHQGHLRYHAFRGMFNDADATVTLTPDGRLASINATSGGQGGAIVKSLATVVGAVALLGPPPVGAFVETVEDKACEKVDAFSAVPAASGDAKGASLVTLSYSVTVIHKAVTGADPTFAVDKVSSSGYDEQSGDRTNMTFVPDAASKPAYDALRGQLGERMATTLKVISTKADQRMMTSTAPTTVTSGEGFPLELNKVAVVNLGIDGHAGDMLQSTQIWGSAVPIPMRETYQLPIPSPAIFGKTAFGISLSDYGSVTSLHYGETGGASEALDAVGQIANVLKPKTTEDAVNDLKGQADLIAQQQRLIGCEVSPWTCK
ncbi:hypothetical protein BKD09_16575 [Bradyrhizobium japonicum]|uniref:Lipoprotein n=1 Tax=Bradyrhizobium japonicum TaxID=375 RepID=A0A1L3F9G9_BRAJP|nr:hypothetical protein [Bradyrhizobium japonicum]APG09941.1 hypothetical protein BKD09_16575 [Bradyrhizobium japonicum]